MSVTQLFCCTPGLAKLSPSFFTTNSHLLLNCAHMTLTIQVFHTQTWLLTCQIYVGTHFFFFTYKGIKGPLQVGFCNLQCYGCTVSVSSVAQLWPPCLFYMRSRTETVWQSVIHNFACSTSVQTATHRSLKAETSTGVHVLWIAAGPNFNPPLANGSLCHWCSVFCWFFSSITTP